jgi:hypothetical protein
MPISAKRENFKNGMNARDLFRLGVKLATAFNITSD